MSNPSRGDIFFPAADSMLCDVISDMSMVTGSLGSHSTLFRAVLELYELGRNTRLRLLSDIDWDAKLISFTVEETLGEAKWTRVVDRNNPVFGSRWYRISD